jgi:cephalosporin-C deacetylase
VIRFDHNYHYDPSYGYNLDRLLAVPAPEAPLDFVEFWQERYRQTIAFSTQYHLLPCGNHAGFAIYDLSYQSTAGFVIGGWLLVPEHQEIRQGIVIGHGYGGREQPDYHINIPETALLFPCFRGISRSRCSAIPEQADRHVLHGIENRHDYVIGGCVEDLWLAVSVLLDIYPQIAGRIGYMGISFGGGIGALAIPWDQRIQRVHFNVPTFGNQPLRLSLPTMGSAAVLKQYSERHGHVLETLAYYDAAVSAAYAAQPAHFAAALFDPVVAPPGQFAIYNAWAADKSLFVLEAGHFDYPNHLAQEQQLLGELTLFFGEHRFNL